MRVYPLTNPFLALRPFERKDAKRFYGRDSDLVLVQSRLYSSRATLLFAGSGVGKTSFLNARLRPALEGHWFLATHRGWAASPPLEALQSSIAAAAPSLQIAQLRPLAQLERIVEEAGAARECLLILDQFEEVFQHWRDSKALDEFASEIARVVHAPTIDGRVLFSMREEFLGELSLFDNLIPDLFNNCYRLKNPTRAETEEIIQKTAFSEQRVECGPGLEPLLDDLLATPRLSTTPATPPELSARSRVPMPFLQIVCHGLWEEQLGNRHPPSIPYSSRFVESHSPGLAAAELEAYCRKKLEGLASDEQDLASAAFGFLMTPGGAKMAYPVDVLASQAKVAEAPLRDVLRKLCAPDVRILREIPAGSDGKPWFELYHDLYARFLSDWKRTHDQVRDEANRRREIEEHKTRIREQVQEAIAKNERRLTFFRRLAGFSPLLLIAGIFAVSSTTAYCQHYRPLARFTAAATLPPDADAYLAARNSVDALKSSLFAKRARRLWAHYWQQRAQLEMLGGATDHALLSQIRSLQEDDADETVRRQLSSWQAFGETMKTFRAPEPIVSVGYLSASNRTYAVLNGCRIVFWDRTTGAVVQTWSPPTRMAGCGAPPPAISPNGTYAVIVSPSRVSLVNLTTREEIWTRDSTANIYLTSFAPDSRRAVVQIGNDATLVSTVDGSHRDLAAVAPTAEFPNYQYSPFTGNLIASFAGRIVIYPPDGSGPGQAIDLKSFPLGATPLDPLFLFPLPQDQFVTVSAGRVFFFSSREPAREVFDGGLGLATYWVNYSVTPGGAHLFIANPLGDICRLSIGRWICEPFDSPLGDRSPTFLATSADTAIVGDLSNQHLREVKLTRSSASTSVAVAKDRTLMEQSFDGRWIITSGSDGCDLVDLQAQIPNRQISKTCLANRFVFSPSGARLLDRGDEREPGGLIDPVSLSRTPVSVTKEFVSWVSDDYASILRPDGTLALVNIRTNLMDPIDQRLGPGFRPTPSVGLLTTCRPTPGASELAVSPNGNHALVPEADGLTLYGKSSGTWSKRTPLSNAKLATLKGFSNDSSRFFALLNGSVIGVWDTAGASMVANLSDNFKPLCAVGFGAGGRSVFAVAQPANFGFSQASELLSWELDGSQVPAWRATVSAGPDLLSHVSFPFPAVTTGRMIAWVSMPSASEIALQVRPTAMGLAPSTLAASIPPFPASMASDGSIRLVMPMADGGLGARLFDPRFSDAQPSQPPASKSWRDVYEDWSARFDIKLDEGTGEYKPISTPPALPALVPDVEETLVYPVVPDREVTVRLEVGFGQAGQARVEGTKMIVALSGPNSTAAIGTGKALAGTSITMLVTVTDMNPSTNVLGATIHLAGGRQDMSRSVKTQVPREGDSRTFRITVNFTDK